MPWTHNTLELLLHGKTPLIVCFSVFKPMPLLSQSLMSTWPKLMKAVGASEKNFEYIDRKPDIPPDGSLAPETLKGHVQFKNITFAYPKQPDTEVLKVCVEKDVLLYYTKSKEKKSCFVRRKLSLFSIMTVKDILMQ